MISGFRVNAAATTTTTTAKAIASLRMMDSPFLGSIGVSRFCEAALSGVARVLFFFLLANQLFHSIQFVRGHLAAVEQLADHLRHVAAKQPLREIGDHQTADLLLPQ